MLNIDHDEITVLSLIIMFFHFNQYVLHMNGQKILINIGDRFSRLVVVRLFGKDKYGKNVYLCKCDCGNEKIVRNSYLTHGRVKSCGCLHKEVSSYIGKRTITYAIEANKTGIQELSGGIICHIKQNAKTRSLYYNLTKEYLWNLFISQKKRCALTGKKIKFGNRYKKLTTTASLDRIDSSKGYIEGNVQWVHKDINIMKRNLSNADFIKISNLVVKHNHENRTT